MTGLNRLGRCWSVNVDRILSGKCGRRFLWDLMNLVSLQGSWRCKLGLWPHVLSRTRTSLLKSLGNNDHATLVLLRSHGGLLIIIVVNISGLD